MHHTRMESPALCPACGCEHDSATEATQGAKIAPTPGDISICFRCGAVNSFTQTLSLEPCNIDTVEGLGDSERNKVKRLSASLRAKRNN